MKLDYHIKSITEHHQLLNLPAPEHPLVSIFSFKQLQPPEVTTAVSFTMDFYTISIKRGCKEKTRYGHHLVDEDAAIMSFFAPGQIMIYDEDATIPDSGWLLVLHPDMLRNHPLGKKMKEYGFFYYALHEALHLSAQEEKMIENIMQQIQAEYRSMNDDYSQDILASHIELLLNYANRFYNRQYITRKESNHVLFVQLQTLIRQHISTAKGLPTVKDISEKLNISPNYLGDLLKKITGQTTQQHIHQQLIEKANELLVTTNCSVSELAYQLGFEYPQSFIKLFKHKTDLSPLEFGQSFKRREVTSTKPTQKRSL